MDGSPASNRGMSGYSGPVESEPPALAGSPQRAVSMTRVILGAAGLIALGALLVVALAISSSYNPTPTNTSGGGPGSNYPGQHHTSSYSHPIGGDGPQSS
jgi:hypothetical protein